MIQSGDAVTWKVGSQRVFATVVETMIPFGRSGREFGLSALPAGMGRSANPGRRVLQYSKYGAEWNRTQENDPTRPGSRENPFLLDWPKPASARYPKLYFGGPCATTSQVDLKQRFDNGDKSIKEYTPHGSNVIGGKNFGIKLVGGRFPTDTRYQIRIGTVVGPLGGHTPGGSKIIDILRPYGFNPTNDNMQGDHVHEMQFGGVDVVESLWPLPKQMNTNAGNTLNSANARFPDNSGRFRFGT